MRNEPTKTNPPKTNPPKTNLINVVRKPENETDYHQKPQNEPTLSKTNPRFSLANYSRNEEIRKQARAAPSGLDQARTEACELVNKVKRTGNHLDAWELGYSLRTVKRLTIHGEFGPWLKTFPYAPQTARKYMRLATMGWEQIVKYDSIRSALDSIRTTREPKPTRSDKVAEPSIAELEATNARLLADNERLRQLHHTPPPDPWQPPEDDHDSTLRAYERNVADLADQMEREKA